MNILVTNNPMVDAKHRERYRIAFIEADLADVLIHVRDLIHAGHRLLTHPMSGSVKPNETPYKTVLVSGERGGTDVQSIRIIEECIITVNKFPPKQILERHLYDLQIVDLSLIESAL